jgi:hypothetical protein
MPRNQKLTKVIAGRTVKAVTPAPGGVLVLFDDQSCMKIKTTSVAAVPGQQSQIRIRDEGRVQNRVRGRFERDMATVGPGLVCGCAG